MIKVGFHGWHPYLAGDQMSADPNGIWLGPLALYLRPFEIDSYWLGQTHGNKFAALQPPPNPGSVRGLDLVVFSWRWKLPDNEKFAERNKAKEDQWALIAECNYHGIPFIVHNQDYMMTSTDIEVVKMMGGLVTAPATKPPPEHETLHFPYLYEEGSFPYEKRGDWITYIGNNYERMDVAKKYLSFPGDEPEVLMYGNWLSPTSGDDRPSPSVVSQAFLNVRFKGKCPQWQVVENLSMAKATIHIGKPQYMSTGLIALRWMEAAAAGTAALIPVEWLPLTDMPGRVRNQADIIKMMNYLKRPGFAKSLVTIQRRKIRKICDPYQWVEMIRKLGANGKV